MNRELSVEEVLRSHPVVCDAVAIRDSPTNIFAFVVLNDAYVEDVLDRKSTEVQTTRKWRKVFDLTQLAKDAASVAVGFNTLGWNSSYTRQPITPEDMREWVQTTAEDILALRPRSVYEVGCGTGMLLMKVAPHCSRYVAADFAPKVLSRLREQLAKVPNLAEHVELMERSADDFSGFDQSSFDTVVINSVVQYFPTVRYLSGVLQKAADTVNDGGRIFVGDILNLPLLAAFATSVTFFQSADEVSIRQLRDQIRRRIETEQQLVLSPSYFLWLPSQIPKISRVEIQPRRDRADNEMSRYRYHAILHVGKKAESLSHIDFFAWNDHRWVVNDIRLLLRQHQGECMGLKGIRNPRIEKDLTILAKLRVMDAAQTVAQLREASQTVEPGIHPQDLVEIGNDFDFQVRLSWAACRADGSYDAVFLPRCRLQDSVVAINWPEPDSSQYVRFANAPGQNKFRRDLIEQLASHCRQNLPPDVVPCDITLVNTIVSTTDDPQGTHALLKAKSAALEFVGSGGA